jgi:Domain of unknown function (DUF1707)
VLDVTLFGMEEFPVDDEQREAALAHLDAEHAHGAFDAAELQRRTTDVRAARTVAQLLAATADPAVAELAAPPSPAAQQYRLALVAGIPVAVVLALLMLVKVL